MNINWQVRLKNKAFWVAMISAMLLLIQQVASLFGVAIDLGEEVAKLLAIVETVFAILALLGVVVDPTTAGIGDPSQALTYAEPREG